MPEDQNEKKESPKKSSQQQMVDELNDLEELNISNQPSVVMA